MKNNTTHIVVAALLIVLAAISRVVLYPNNFSPIIGVALFAGVVFKDKRFAFILPIAAMLLADLIFEVSGLAPGFWGMGQAVGYGILMLITFLAFSMKKISVPNVVGYSLGASLLFFILSNLSFFLIDNKIYHTYTQDWAGLQQCYIMALPFLKNSILADLFYSGILFGSYSLITRFVLKPKTEVNY